ncbi:alpha/beta fold hydrolase [Arthrobacter sp. SDTb3-6]|uniref:alpha/beta fold hydrolase n=1 Tax=Arthrobacter sp. SDTb3-6 TaxID=2713571 RepID=UPI00159EABB0|nr:alpha/beta hydrolase [Arthrobacter sp. SDTb3-6]NVM98182.1 alpha/beta hydrolase [Arthrobacter sp. SDTb3-6]
MAGIVLVHGLWSDGSSWLRVIAELCALGHNPVAAQLGLETFDDDVASVRRTLATVEGPVLLAGWSYGGVVIGEAAREIGREAGSAALGKVGALAYVAGFAPAEGESVDGLSRRHPGSLIPRHVVVAGAYTYIDRAHFGEVIAHELPAESAAVGAAVQKLTRIGLDRVAVGRPAWLDLPCHYLLTTDDRAVPPALQREMAARMGADVTEIDSSHAPLLTRPREVAAFLDKACGSLPPGG